jgi:dihydroxyacetone kinase-like predicted kinase
MAAEHVFILPNNGNIVLTAQQAAEVTDKPVTVIPAKSIPEGIAALVAFNPVEDAEVNERRMAEAASHVKSGQVTFAVRDTKKDGFTIEKDDFLAIQNGKIVATDKEPAAVTKKLLQHMVTAEDEIVTILYGADTDEQQAEELAEFIEKRFPEAEVEIQYGGQPVYYYIISAE